eukprot:CAMPEP_0118681966 /NCGR_PEP_ID=MMETSP0800-20121206/5231_1 /TAXON_ID=210618 ORGANISM="Striatella unipunctata, Strain CCMP2910" /NCGR_SAMPLE_ID=MMETSP0800 /ASSEMBLY_ACC=CAM_ASM_000638 /LENGTH=225 /DNA_ID=CAMNT_0006578319 /DNA_START=34 /DNA_END=711 /DNA_ORIENTATION=+
MIDISGIPVNKKLCLFDMNNTKGLRKATSADSDRTNKKKKSKGVRFSFKDMEFVEPSLSSDDESDDEYVAAEDRWYSGADIKQFKLSSKALGRSCARKGRGCTLTRTFSLDDDQETVNQWVLNDHRCRGLERYSNHEHATERFIFQANAISAILHAHAMGFDDSAIAKVSEDTTKRAVEFARRVGEADAIAARAKPNTPAIKRSKSYAGGYGTDEESDSGTWVTY